MISHISRNGNAPYCPVESTGKGMLNLKNVVKILAAPFVWIVKKIRAIWKKIFGPKSLDLGKDTVDRKPPSTSAKKAGGAGYKPSADSFSKVEDPELAKKALEFERYCHSKKEEILALFNTPNGPKVKIKVVPASRIVENRRDLFNTNKPIKYRDVEFCVVMEHKRSTFDFQLSHEGFGFYRIEDNDLVRISKEDRKHSFVSDTMILDKAKSNEEQLNQLKRNIQATFPIWNQIYAYLESNSAKFKRAYDCTQLGKDLHLMHYQIYFPEVGAERVKVKIRVNYVYMRIQKKSSYCSDLTFGCEITVDRENRNSFCNDFKRLIDRRFDRFVRKEAKRMGDRHMGNFDFKLPFEDSSDEDERDMGSDMKQVRECIEALVGIMEYEETVEKKLINLFYDGKFDEFDPQFNEMKRKGRLRFHPDKSADENASENFQKFNGIIKEMSAPLKSLRRIAEQKGYCHPK